MKECVTHHHACDCREALFARLRHTAKTYMAAVECYNANPWDRVNVRKYAATKKALRDVLKAAYEN
jgi:hypothetical protein